MGGIVGAAVACALIWYPVAAMTVNLPGLAAAGIRFGLTALAVIVGFLAGSAVSRRARRTHRHLGLFSGLTGGFAGGFIGAAMVVVVTLGYLATYGHIPPDPLDEVLAGLAVLSLTALGFFLGFLLGMVLGFFFVGVLKIGRRPQPSQDPRLSSGFDSL